MTTSSYTREDAERFAQLFKVRGKERPRETVTVEEALKATEAFRARSSAYRNDRDADGENSRRGKDAEDRFLAMSAARGESQEPIEDNRNWGYHSDFEDKTSGLLTEVKGFKKVARHDGVVSTDFQWVELRNVNGDPGWMYGKADRFAFEVELGGKRGFLIVSREKLQAHIASHLQGEYVKDPSKAVYKKYRREGRLDRMTLVPVADLEKIADERWA